MENQSFPSQTHLLSLNFLPIRLEKRYQSLGLPGLDCEGKGPREKKNHYLPPDTISSGISADNSSMASLTAVIFMSVIRNMGCIGRIRQGTLTMRLLDEFLVLCSFIEERN